MGSSGSVSSPLILVRGSLHRQFFFSLSLEYCSPFVTWKLPSQPLGLDLYAIPLRDLHKAKEKKVHPPTDVAQPSAPYLWRSEFLIIVGSHLIGMLDFYMPDSEAGTRLVLST